MEQDTQREAPAGNGPVEVEERLRQVMEELATVSGEVAAQQREIDELLAREQDARATLRAITGAVPVALLTTDTDGAVLEANLAAGILLGVGVGRLLRTPVQACVAQQDRPGACDLLARAVRDGSAGAVLTLAPRNGPPVPVDVQLTVPPGPWTDSRHPEGVRQVQWALVPRAGTTPGGRRLHDALQAMAGLRHLPVGEVSTTELLARVSVLVRQAVPAADWCSITLGDPAAPEATATESAQAQQLDGAQWRTGEGPCSAAYREGVPVTVADLRGDPRWPALAAALEDVRAGAAVAVPVTLAGDVLGVVNLYSAHPGALGEEQDVEHALVFAEATAAVLRDARRLEQLRGTAAQLQDAMRSRAGIEQAKGAVAAWLGCTVDEAFEVISTLSQDRNVKLRELAALVVADTATGAHVRPLLLRQQARLRRRG